MSAFKAHSWQPDVIDDLCDLLTIALCSVDRLDSILLNKDKNIDIKTLQTVLLKAGQLAWEIQALGYKARCGSISIDAVSYENAVVSYDGISSVIHF